MRETILLVDDEAEIRRTLLRELRLWARDAGIRLETADSGEAALTYMDVHGKDVAVMVTDQRMPGISGSDLIHDVATRFPTTVCLVLTGHTAKKDVESVLSSGIYGFLIKPWNRGELQSQMDRAFDEYRRRQQMEEVLRRERLELEMARDFQRRFFDVEAPKEMGILDIDYASYTASRTSVGGDYLDFVTLSGQEILILIGDVAGHALRATFLAAIIKSIVTQEMIPQAYEHENDEVSPASILGVLNRRIASLGPAVHDLFASFLVLRVDSGTGRCVMSCAGCPPPLLVKQATTEELVNQSLVLGVDLAAEYHDTTFRLLPGECLFLYTDGVLPHGGSPPTSHEGELRDLILERCCRDEDEDGKAELDSMLIGADLHDDITIVRIQVRGS